MQIKPLTIAPAILAASVVFHSGAALAQSSITVVSFGGAMTRALDAAIYQPFSEATGIRVISEDYNGGLGQIRSQVEFNNIDWDVVQIEAGDPLLGCDEGLLEEIDPTLLSAAPDGTPASDDFIESGLLPCAVANIVWSTVIAYNTAVFPASGQQPQTIEDFFDLETFPGTRGLRRSAIGTMEWALMADGVPRAEVYEVLSTREGMERALARLDTIKESVIWWEAGAQAPQLLGDREVVMTAAWNGRIFDATVNEGQPFAILWDTQVMAMDHWAIPRGTPRLEQALAFVRYASETANSARVSEHIAYGSPRLSAAVLQPTHASRGIDMSTHLPTHPANSANALINDPEFWNEYGDEVSERFNNWLLR